MLREAADVWWPRVHREIVEKANKCLECIRAGKSLKCLKVKKSSEPKGDKPNTEILLDFAVPLQNEPNEKKFMLVSVYNNSGWPEALCLTNPTTERILKFLAQYKAQHRNPQRKKNRSQNGV